MRYEIESIERNLRNYDMQIKYSTVNLDLREVEVYTPTVPVRRTFGQKLADSLSDGWNGFTRGIRERDPRPGLRPVRADPITLAVSHRSCDRRIKSPQKRKGEKSRAGSTHRRTRGKKTPVQPYPGCTGWTI